MMTPCTQKLTAARKKQFAKGPKPVQLFSQKSQDNSASDEEESPKISHENEENTLMHDDDNPLQ